MKDLIVEIDSVSMLFNLSKEKVDNIKEYVIKLIKRQLMFNEFWALKDISFNIYRGESLGIIGLNGSGKSTLLKIIAGVMKPTKGKVSVYGSVAPLIELGAGFDPDLSARENVFLNGAVLGYSKAQMKEKFDEIIDFAELWDFIDVPIKNYSSGMVARLGFSIATISRPDILIVDEILGVGDFKFKEKCENRMNEIISNGSTVILVSHSIEQIKLMCKKAVWLKSGQLVMQGEAEEVCNEYTKNA
jgi:ABC-type polysaccharide/polyol phosphate transport system ATPase subunit